MENTLSLQPLSYKEMIEYNDDGFAYDVGCVIGFIFRSTQNPLRQAEAYAI